MSPIPPPATHNKNRRNLSRFLSCVNTPPATSTLGELGPLSDPPCSRKSFFVALRPSSMLDPSIAFSAKTARDLWKQQPSRLIGSGGDKLAGAHRIPGGLTYKTPVRSDQD
jgi:hypothetical protein